jgi:hypothetical protein
MKLANGTSFWAMYVGLLGPSRNIPDEGYSRNVPDEGYSRNVPDEGYSRNASCALKYKSSHL